MEIKKCAGPQCVNDAKTKGLCHGHYMQQYKGNELKPLRTKRGTSTGWIKGNGYKYKNIGQGQIRLVHRLVMEEALGRPLMREEHVHHINGDRSDNRIENLELWNTSHPCGQRVHDKVAWAEQILRQYAPEKLVLK